MREMLPTSKSSYKEIRTCPYHWYATHNLGLREKPGKAALIGLDVEHVWTRVIRDGLDMETAMAQLQYEESKDLLFNAIAITEKSENIEEYQADVYLDESGYQVIDCRKEEAILRCILDRVERRPTETLVQDLKTGQEYTDWFEINVYAAAGRAQNPFVDRVRFQYLWAKSAKVTEYIFDFDGSPHVIVTLPSGEKQTHKDWWTNIATNILSLEDVEPEPKPGEHCGSWYGKPCHVIGNCPAHKQTDALIAEAHQPMQSTTAILLKALANGEHVELGPLMASEALGAVLHAEAYIEKIKARIQEWSRENGPVQVGEYEFSYQPRESIDVDTAQALQVMFESGMHFTEMAKAINISKSSINKLPKVFAEIKEYIMAYCANNNNKVTESWTKRKTG